jgi:hypothetical protein
MDWSQGCPRCSSIVTTTLRKDPPERPFAALMAVPLFYAQCQQCGFREWKLGDGEWFDDLNAVTERAREIVAERGTRLWPPPVLRCAPSSRNFGSWADRPADPLDPTEEWTWDGEKVTHACGSDDVRVSTMYPSFAWLPEVKIMETHVWCQACHAGDCLPGTPFGNCQIPPLPLRSAHRDKR